MVNTPIYKLCIIDDIRSVVEGIEALSWDQYHIEVVGTAYNGADGLSMIEQMAPDIIITDIRMPKMDGLAMIESVLQQNYHCKIILISSYTDFDYAHQAIKLGAFDFILKPFSKEDIISAVVRARDEMIETQQKLLNTQKMELKLKESLPLLIQEYMELLLNYPISWEEAQEKWSYLNISLQSKDLIVFLIEIDGFQERMLELSVHQVELTRFSLQNIVEETLQKAGAFVVFRTKFNRFVVVTNTESTTMAATIADRCCSHIRQYTKFTVSIGVSGLIAEVSSLSEGYRQAEWALSHHLYTSGDSVISYMDVNQKDRFIPLTLEYNDELVLALRSGNSERIEQLFHKLYTRIESLPYRPSPDFLLSLYEELSASVIRALHELGVYTSIKSSVDRFKNMKTSSSVTLSSLQGGLIQLCKEATDYVRKGLVSEGDASIYRAMEFVQKQLHREITVAECAAQVHLSASYFSSVFKKVTGMTLTQYVTAERIRKAKTMLIQGTPVQEIASSVGYEERRYFSDMFKRSTGMTPSEFRESYQTKEQNLQ